MIVDCGKVKKKISSREKNCWSNSIDHYYPDKMENFEMTIWNITQETERAQMRSLGGFADVCNPLAGCLHSTDYITQRLTPF